MYRASKRKRHIAEINVIPYIDVMLVLLVIFMITAPLLNQGIELDLPQADAKPIPPSELRTLVLDIDRTGQYYIYLAGDSPQAVSSEQAQTRTAIILSETPETPVLIQADAAIAYGSVVQAMTLLQEAGAAQIGLATQPPEN